MKLGGSKTYTLPILGLVLEVLVLLAAGVVAKWAPEALGALAPVLSAVAMSGAGLAGAGAAAVGVRHWGAAEGSSGSGSDAD